MKTFPFVITHLELNTSLLDGVVELIGSVPPGEFKTLKRIVKVTLDNGRHFEIEVDGHLPPMDARELYLWTAEQIDAKLEAEAAEKRRLLRVMQGMEYSFVPPVDDYQIQRRIHYTYGGIEFVIAMRLHDADYTELSRLRDVERDQAIRKRGAEVVLRLADAVNNPGQSA